MNRRSFFGALIALPFLAKLKPKSFSPTHQTFLKITDSLGKDYRHFRTHNLYRSPAGVLWETAEVFGRLKAK